MRLIKIRKINLFINQNASRSIFSTQVSWQLSTTNRQKMARRHLMHHQVHRSGKGLFVLEQRRSSRKPNHSQEYFIVFIQNLRSVRFYPVRKGTWSPIQQVLCPITSIFPVRTRKALTFLCTLTNVLSSFAKHSKRQM